MPLDPERLDDEVVQTHIKYLQDHLEYLLGIDKDESTNYESPTEVVVKFRFLKKRLDKK